MKRRQKSGFSSSRSSKITVKGKEKKKERREEKEEKKKSNGCTLGFYNSYFGDSFWPKKTVGRQSSFGGNVIKNPARYILWILPSKYHLSKIIRHV